MRAELRQLDSVELDTVLLSDYMPADPTNFGLVVDAYIALPGVEREELFYFTVCSPRWLGDRTQQDGYSFGRNHLLLPTFDYQLLWHAISDLCESIEGPDWETVARRIGRYGLWEYDDFYGPQSWLRRQAKRDNAGG